MFEDILLRTIIMAPPILLALSVHESAHAWAADRLGDHTARMLGRVTLNPIRHLDPVGTLAIFLSGMFGWAKPVPVNPRNFRDPGRAMMWVALAGPVTNLFLAALFAGVYKLFVAAGDPLGGPVSRPLFLMVEMSIFLNVGLAVFNLIPVPPLDGSKVLANLLPSDKALTYLRIEPYGFMILLVLIFTGVIHSVMSPIVYLTVGLLMGGVF
ncbi:MAG TPA: site-2 protease family protein [Deltaproteobacteria bacterium]|nr:site-2 protease family protein [Deltaproteobacteria bacterium]